MAGINRLREVNKRQKENALRKFGHPGATTPCELPGEPLIYSIKAPLGQRVLPRQYFQNRNFFSKFRTWFRRWEHRGSPVVMIVTFYVSPNEVNKHKVSKKELNEEKTPAVFSFEICEYLLSLMESMRLADLFNNYQQVVKIDVQKFYSSKPRTVLQYMHYEDWKKFYSVHPFYTKAKVSPTEGYAGLLQCELKEHAPNAKGDSGQAGRSGP